MVVISINASLEHFAAANSLKHDGNSLRIVVRPSIQQQRESLESWIALMREPINSLGARLFAATLAV
jgi:hypothetical protein